MRLGERPPHEDADRLVDRLERLGTKRGVGLQMLQRHEGEGFGEAATPVDARGGHLESGFQHCRLRKEVGEVGGGQAVRGSVRV